MPGRAPILGTVIAALLAALSGAEAARAQLLVAVERVRVEPVVREVTLLGRVVARFEGEVASEVAGSVAEVLVRSGDSVARGAPLVRLERARMEQAVARARTAVAAAEADLAAARGELELLELELARLTRLRGSAAFPRARFENQSKQVRIAAQRLKATEARLAAARVELAARERDLADSEIRAPFSGIVLETLVSPGRYLRVGEPVVRLLDTAELEVEAEVPREILPELQPGQMARMRLFDQNWILVLRTVIPVEDPRTASRPARFRFRTSPPALLAAGQAVELELRISSGESALTVPKDALLPHDHADRLFVVRDQRAEERRVILGPFLGERVVVRDGLAPGELVVVRGNERLRDGMPVRIASARARSDGRP